MVECRHISWLQLACLHIVLLRLVQLVLFVVAERSIVKSLEVLWVLLNRTRIVNNSLLIVLIFAVSEPTIMEEVGLSALQVNCSRKALNCLFEETHPIERNALIVVCECVLGLYFDRLRVILDSLLKLAQLVVSEASVEKSLEMVWEDLKSLRVVLHRKVVIALFAGLVPLGVVLLGVLLDLWVLLQHLAHLLTDLRLRGAAPLV